VGNLSSGNLTLALEKAGLASLEDGNTFTIIKTMGIDILGTPVGTPEYVKGALTDVLEDMIEEAEGLLKAATDDIVAPTLQHVFHLIRVCVIPRANHLLRTIHPHAVGELLDKFDLAVVALVLNLILGMDLDAAASSLTTKQLGAIGDRLHLPTSMGGVGLTGLRLVHEAAYLGSRLLVGASMKKRVPWLFNVNSDGDPEFMLGLAALVRQVNEGGILFPAEEPCAIWTSFEKTQFKMQRLLMERKDKYIRRFVDEGMTAEGKLIWDSCGTAEAARPFSTIPCFPAQQLPNHVFKLALATQLGVTLKDINPALFSGTECTLCGMKDVGNFTEHAMCCRSTAPAAVSGRHNAIRDTLAGLLRKLGYSVRVETAIENYADRDNSSDTHPVEQQDHPLPPDKTKHRADVTLHAGGAMTRLVDVTVRMPNRHAKTAGSGARLGENHKLAWYKKHYHRGSIKVIPFALEPFGYWGEDAQKAIRIWSQRATSMEPPQADPRYGWFVDAIISRVSMHDCRPLRWDCAGALPGRRRIIRLLLHVSLPPSNYRGVPSRTHAFPHFLNVYQLGGHACMNCVCDSAQRPIGVRSELEVFRCTQPRRPHQRTRFT
jgi:hypothetical protein